MLRWYMSLVRSIKTLTGRFQSGESSLCGQGCHAMKQHNDALNETAKEKSASTSKSSVDTNDDVEQEASST